MQDRFFEQGVSFSKVKPVARSQDNDQSIISIADIVQARPSTPAESNISDHDDAADETGSTKSGNNDDHDVAIESPVRPVIESPARSLTNPSPKCLSSTAHTTPARPSLKRPSSTAHMTPACTPVAPSPKRKLVPVVSLPKQPRPKPKMAPAVKEITNESGESEELSTDGIEEMTACDDLDEEASRECGKSSHARQISGNGAAGGSGDAHAHGAKERGGRTRSTERISPQKHAGDGGGERQVPPRKKWQLGEDDELFMEGSSKDAKRCK
ncbi:hypothetical protein FRC06_006135 [Ceratobasidium sp. 370]|nr:hypothetical protein FRC06_006135 [Ceratobasidium sp. 370]